MRFEELNLDQCEAPGEFKILPAGEYQARVLDVQEKSNEKGTSLVWSFVTEDGSRFWDRMIIKHTNPVAENIGRGRLKALRDAAKPTAASSTELIGTTVVASVRVRKREDNGEMANEIRTYKKAGANGTVIQNVPPASPPSDQPPADPKRRPW